MIWSSWSRGKERPPQRPRIWSRNAAIVCTTLCHMKGAIVSQGVPKKHRSCIWHTLYPLCKRQHQLATIHPWVRKKPNPLKYKNLLFVSQMVLLHSLLLESFANKKYFVVLFNPWSLLLGSSFFKIKLELVAQQNQWSNFVICKSELINVCNYLKLKWRLKKKGNSL